MFEGNSLKNSLLNRTYFYQQFGGLASAVSQTAYRNTADMEVKFMQIASMEKNQTVFRFSRANNEHHKRVSIYKVDIWSKVLAINSHFCFIANS